MEKSVAHEYSAGGLVFRKNAVELELLLIQVRESKQGVEHRIYTFPKGWTGDHPGESVEQTALREVREEGRVEAEILADLNEIQYFFIWGGKRVSKKVRFYLMRYLSGDPKDHDHEVEEALWLPLAEARAKLSYKTDLEVLGRAEKVLPKVDFYAG